MERNIAVDISKGIGILLVMLGHLAIPMWSVNVIYFFHMPFFIAISAFFFKNERGIKETWSKGKRILISYLFYGIVFLLINALLLHNFSPQLLLSFIFAKPNIWGILFFGVFWFVIALFVIKLIASVVKINLVSLLIAVILYFILLLTNSRFQFMSNLPFAIAQAVVLFVFFAFGFYMRKFINAINMYVCMYV